MSAAARPLERATFQRARELARERRAAIARASPLPVDTAHLISRCPRCGTLGLDTLGYEAGAPLTVTAEGLCHTVAEYAAALSVLFRAGDDAVAVREACRCGTSGAQLETQCVRYFRAMPGTGAELLLEGVRVTEGGAAVRWSLARVPIDGIEQWLEGFDDGVVRQAFDRPIALTQDWHRLFEFEGTRVLAAGTGLWLFAAPATDDALPHALEALRETGPGVRVLPLDGPALASPAWAWLRGWLSDPRFAGWTAGIAVDLSVLRYLLGVSLKRWGLTPEAGPEAEVLLATQGEIPWPIELETVARECLRRAVRLADGAAAATASTMAAHANIEGFLRTVQEIIPGITFRREGMRAYPVLPDGRTGLPFDLMVDPFRAYASQLELERDLRFNLDLQPAQADPLRVCPCGAAATLTARLMPWSQFERALGSPGRTPASLAVFGTADAREAVSVPAIECDRHIRHLADNDLERFGLDEAALLERVERDLAFQSFLFRSAAQHDASGRHAFIVQGPYLGSIVLHEALVAGLLRALGQPIAGGFVDVTAVTPNVVVLSETGFDPAVRANMCAAGAILDADGQRPGAAWSVQATLPTSAPPRGEFRPAEDAAEAST